jgi:CBS domain containing-hemolysin-like protein
MTAAAVTLLFLLGNAFFVGAEFAVIASRRTVLEPLAESSRRARTALRAMGQVPLMIAGAQLGITICSLGLGAITEPALHHALIGPFEALRLGQAAHPVAFVLALGLVVFTHPVIGEMVPKNLTLAGPERAVLWLGPPMLGFCLGTKPLLVAMRWASRAILGLWRIEATDAVKTVFTAEELAGLVGQARTEGLLDAEEHARITAALALSERTARDALRPWAEVVTVAEDVSPAALEVLATRTRRSRFPVVERASRRVVGFVHVKDVLGMVGPQRRAAIPRELIRPLAVVPPERTLADLLLAMRRERRHLVLVSGGRTPLGVVSLDDVLNAVVGKPVTGRVTPTRTATG